MEDLINMAMVAALFAGMYFVGLWLIFALDPIDSEDR